MRLATLLLAHPQGRTPASYALAALMSLNAARLPARLDASGELMSLFDQDRSLWDRRLIDQGLKLLSLAAEGTDVSPYHLEAAVAAVHARAASVEDTDWSEIVWLYDMLMAIRPGPIVALNRAIAVAQEEGPERGLEEIRSIDRPDRFANYPFFPAALGELELRRGNRSAARGHFHTALALARSSVERRYYDRRLSACDNAADGRRPARLNAAPAR